jgi:hypothetical protein
MKMALYMVLKETKNLVTTAFSIDAQMQLHGEADSYF